ncbi:MULTISPECIES: DUF3530 family protein [Ferrimonas]|uniref:DUF3530 family protein n=1 Tax=Ferrimonas TaxID=44011 RepID=UPI0003FE8E34|nr:MULTISPECIES: DUF3530 family protein [Ferrimonas]USD37965.1 DUF3530 family protein [Ferrimonas sp. SCSIO 43195]
MIARLLLSLLLFCGLTQAGEPNLYPSNLAGVRAEVVLVEPQRGSPYPGLAQALIAQLPDLGWQVRLVPTLPEDPSEVLGGDTVWLAQGEVVGTLAAKLADGKLEPPLALVSIGGFQWPQQDVPTLAARLVMQPSPVLDVISDWDHPLSLAGQKQRAIEASRSNKRNYRQWRNYLDYQQVDDHQELITRIHGWLSRQLR